GPVFKHLRPIPIGVLVLTFLAAACSSAPPAGTVPPPPGPPPPVGRTLFDNMPISQGGGTLTYTKAGDPLNGLTITVPAAAYPTATTWTVTTDSSGLPTLPSGFSQVGPTLVIGNGQDVADSVMTLTMPMRLAPNETVAPFYFDPVSKTLEGIPLVAGTDSPVTLATKHFTADEMVIPGTGAALSR